MKIYYDRLSKEDKKELLNKYKVDKKEMYKKMNNMFILCYVCIIVGIVVLIYDCFFNKNITNFVIDIIITIFGIVSLLKMNSYKRELLNKFALDNNFKKNSKTKRS